MFSMLAPIAILGVLLERGDPFYVLLPASTLVLFGLLSGWCRWAAGRLVPARMVAWYERAATWTLRAPLIMGATLGFLTGLLSLLLLMRLYSCSRGLRPSVFERGDLLLAYCLALVVGITLYMTRVVVPRTARFLSRLRGGDRPGSP